MRDFASNEKLPRTTEVESIMQNGALWPRFLLTFI